MSRLARAKPSDCALPFNAHGIASVQKPRAKLPTQFSARGNRAQGDEAAPAGPVREWPLTT
jgi:hypothetical protein